MTRILFFRMVLRKLLEITNNKPILVSTIFFTITNISLFSLHFHLFSVIPKEVNQNQEQCSLCCISPCFLLLLCTQYKSLQFFQHTFHKLKAIGVLRPIFTDYVISCDYANIFTHILAKDKIL